MIVYTAEIDYGYGEWTLYGIYSTVPRAENALRDRGKGGLVFRDYVDREKEHNFGSKTLRHAEDGLTDLYVCEHIVDWEPTRERKAGA